MLNNRMLAVAAVLALAVPALGAAAPIVVPPQAEQLVEGHTVFTVIEVANATTTNETRFAAAVAVLVREYNAINNNVRFPGVLWFNDQYLVNPQRPERNAAAYRYPCGGAVLAVNEGDPDPRVLMLSAGVTVDGQTRGAAPGETRDPVTGVVYGPGSVNDGATYGNGHAWANANADASSGNVDTTDPTQSTPPSANPTAYSTGALGAQGRLLNSADPSLAMFGIDYEESYLVTDPNDHVWIIDKYVAYHRTGTTGLPNDQVYYFPVWAVNVLGLPVFVPDDGVSNCYPFYDLAVTAADLVNGPIGDANAELTANGVPAQIPTLRPCGRVGSPASTVTDDPCAGYAEPSRWPAAAPATAAAGYCYGGQAAQNPGETAPNCDRTRKPLRLYNAVLYFNLEDLTVYDGTIKTHTPTSTDTNGCQVGTEWTCPGYDGANPATGDDNAEGNSHAFHPRTHAGHTDVEPCPPYFGGPNPTNHGGSSSALPGTAKPNGAYAGTACDYSHTTRNIDVYFSGQGRPFIPVYRNFEFTDFQGSSAPFQDYPTAYGSP